MESKISIYANVRLKMRQTDYLEKRNGEWKIIHEHTSMADGWNGIIEE